MAFDPVQTLRIIKHQGLVLRKQASAARLRARDAFREFETRARPPVFDIDDYRQRDGEWSFDAFLRFDASGKATPRTVPRRIYAFWTGTNDLTPNRKRCLADIYRVNHGFEITLVTPDTLGGFLRPEHPLHPSYVYLSDVHKSDYLRAYFMHHYGGGYTDIKSPSARWDAPFDLIESSESVWMVGYREPTSEHMAQIDTKVGKEMRHRASRIGGNGSFIMRPRTRLTQEWLGEVERRLDYFASLLKPHPAKDPYGSNPDYPVPWTMLMGQVLQPLQLKYSEHVRMHPVMTPAWSDHR